ncbi:hypothetical protein EP10_001364 [Geobacillus icigianus]|uniref:Aldo/keto reductase n=1 Tax=Geobacillus icigianus TaxID=1430331 RepID=A0ABU6BFD5_9BACL|nr:hypothetical protein [Geobacillus icigianus]
MRYRQLGNTDLRVSELSFGTWALDGLNEKADGQEAHTAGIDGCSTAIVKRLCPFARHIRSIQ